MSNYATLSPFKQIRLRRSAQVNVSYWQQLDGDVCDVDEANKMCSAAGSRQTTAPPLCTENHP